MRFHHSRRRKKHMIDRLIDTIESVLGTTTSAIELYLSDHPDIVEALRPYLLRGGEDSKIAVEAAKTIKDVRTRLREKRFDPETYNKASSLAQEALELLRNGLPRNAYQKALEAYYTTKKHRRKTGSTKTSVDTGITVKPVVPPTLEGVISIHRRTIKEPSDFWNARNSSGPFRDVSWSITGLLAVAAGGVYVYKPSGAKLWESVGTATRSVEWSPEGTLLAAADVGIGSLKVYTSDGTLLWSRSPSGGIVSVSWNPKAGLTAGSPTGVLEHYNLDGELLWKNETHEINIVSWDPRGELLAVGGPKGELSVHRVEDSSMELLWEKRFDGKIRGIAWSPDNRLLAVAAGKHVYTLNRMGTDIWSDKLASIGEAVAGLSWSADGNLLAVAIASGYGERGEKDATGRYVILERGGTTIYKSPVIGASGRMPAWSKGGSLLAVAHWDGVSVYRLACNCEEPIVSTDPVLDEECTGVCGLTAALASGVRPRPPEGPGWKTFLDTASKLYEGDYPGAALEWGRSVSRLRCSTPGVWSGGCSVLWEAGDLFWLGNRIKASVIAYRLGLEPERLYAIAKPEGPLGEAKNILSTRLDSIGKALDELPYNIVNSLTALASGMKNIEDLETLVKSVYEWYIGGIPPINEGKNGKACNKSPVKLYVQTGKEGFYLDPGECASLPGGSKISIPGIPELNPLEYKAAKESVKVEGFPEELLEIYEPLEYLGGGGMASVWLVRRRSDGSTYALKHPLNKRLWKRLVEEAVYWKNLVHPNIIRLYDYYLDPIPHILMEPARGITLEGRRVRSLRDLIKLRGRIPPLSAALIAYAVASGLEHAHTKGIAHLDLKPSNVLLSPGPVAKLTDWGISRLYQSDRASLYGVTPAYAAPEQLSLEEPPGPKTDVYQVGLLLVEMLTGEIRRKPEGLPRLLSSIAESALNLEARARPSASMLASQLWEAARTLVLTALPEDLALAAELRGLGYETVTPEELLPSREGWGAGVGYE